MQIGEKLGPSVQLTMRVINRDKTTLIRSTINPSSTVYAFYEVLMRKLIFYHFPYGYCIGGSRVYESTIHTDLISIHETIVN